MKSPITTAVLIASVVLTANAAMAAHLPAHKYAAGTSHARGVVPAASRPPRGELNNDVGQFIQSMFGGSPVQYSRLMRDASRRQVPSSRSTDWSPSYDSSPSVDTGSAAADSQAASDAEVQAIQSMNDENALNASMAAAEAQNEAAQAAAIQTEINANN